MTLLTIRRFHVLATSAILSDTKEQPAPSRAILFGSVFIISKRARDAWSALHYKKKTTTIHITVHVNLSLFYGYRIQNLDSTASRVKLACVAAAGVRKGGKGERRAREARKDRAHFGFPRFPPLLRPATQAMFN